MTFTILKIIISAVIIAFTSWLAGKKPELAGFIVALPLMTLLVLPFNYAEYEDADNAVKFARSIMLAVPISLTFFLPFLFADKIMDTLPGGFWTLYGLGLIALTLSYFVHKFIMAQL